MFGLWSRGSLWQVFWQEIQLLGEICRGFALESFISEQQHVVFHFFAQQASCNRICGQHQNGIVLAELSCSLPYHKGYFKTIDCFLGKVCFCDWMQVIIYASAKWNTICDMVRHFESPLWIQPEWDCISLNVLKEMFNMFGKIYCISMLMILCKTLYVFNSISTVCARLQLLQSYANLAVSHREAS